MIKFSYAIHKPTNNVINYDQWLHVYKNGMSLSIMGKLDYFDRPTTHPRGYTYNAEAILFSDDFEFIHKPSISYLQLRKMYECLPVELNTGEEAELKTFIYRQLRELERLKGVYDIDLLKEDSIN